MTLIAYFRNQLRSRYDIEGTVTEDLVGGFVCSCCALCQMSSQMKYEETEGSDSSYAQFTNEFGYQQANDHDYECSKFVDNQPQVFVHA